MESTKETITVAVTVWGNRVSPVFDSASMLLVAEITEAGIKNTYALPFSPGMVSQLVNILKEKNIKTVICGAISEEPASLLEGAGIELISFIAGNIDRVLHNYIQEQPAWSDLSMPGCQRKICCQGRIRKGHELGIMFASDKGNDGKGMRLHRRWDDQDRRSQAQDKKNTGRRYNGK